MRGAALRVAAKWRNDLESLPMRLQSTVPELLSTIGHKFGPPINIKCGDRVQVHWWTDDKWYPGIVQCVLPDGYMRIVFEDCADTAEVWKGQLRRLNKG